ncbi:hypothetical protein [Rahnella ecdela]|jgi:hypothetical protein|uniref:Multiple stress resistance protein BhsA n=1 Tax=Rahnella ecdela TaxID=2816250 RepID=A0ABS6LB34_9GAMM|nr:hypothetical protein [Rahnella ecdela]MBU9844165.1 hypothetical protein [Rahnella ecdela]
MKRTTLALFSLMIAMTTFNSIAALHPSSSQEVASELNRKASESGTRPSTTIDASAHNKLTASSDYLQ